MHVVPPLLTLPQSKYAPLIITRHKDAQSAEGPQRNAQPFAGMPTAVGAPVGRACARDCINSVRLPPIIAAHSQLGCRNRDRKSKKNIFVFSSLEHEVVGNSTSCHEKFLPSGDLNRRFSATAKLLISKLKEDAFFACSLCKQRMPKRLPPVARQWHGKCIVNLKSDPPWCANIAHPARVPFLPARSRRRRIRMLE